MCNGWRNYQTWTISLWYGDCFSSMAEEQKLHGDYLEEMVAEMEMHKIPESSLAADIMNDFLKKVDWDELADHYNADSSFEEEEENQEIDLDGGLSAIGEEEEEYDGMGNRLDGTGA